jgi:hypothetical protein
MREVVEEIGAEGNVSDARLTYAPSPATKSIEEIFNLDQNATNADLPKSRDTLVWMSPDDFLAMAAPTKADYNMSFAAGNEKTDAILAGINQGDLIDVPHLKIFDKDGVAQVEGHEGRHRASLMKELGYDTMPVVINSHRIRWANQAQAGGDQIGGKWPSVLRSEIDPWGTVDRKSRDIPFPVKDPRGSQTELKTPEGAPSPLEGTLDMSTEARNSYRTLKGQEKYNSIPSTWTGEAKQIAKRIIDSGISVQGFSGSTQSKSKYIERGIASSKKDRMVLGGRKESSSNRFK